MYEKSGKYWSEFSTFKVVAVVLDPCFKLQFVQWSFKKVYGDSFEYELEFSKVKDAVKGLYKAYATSYSSTYQVNFAARGHGECVGDVPNDDLMMDFDTIPAQRP